MKLRTLAALAAVTTMLGVTTLGTLGADEHVDPWDLDKRFGGWTTLFNGKDLTGWQTAKTNQQGGKNRWQVEDGTLTNISGGMNDICTLEEFTDYELLIEYRLPPRKNPDKAHGNSGVYLRGTCEVQVYDSYGKADKDLAPADCGAIYGKNFVALTNVQKKPGEWNQYRIIHVGDHITVYHNDVLIQDNVYQKDRTGGAMGRYPTGDKHKLTGRKGPLMLQGDHTKVWYRNIRIRPLTVGKGWRSIWSDGDKDLSAFTDIVSYNRGDGTITVECGARIADILRFLLARGRLLHVTPDMRHLTLGGVLAGVGGGSASFRHGYFHEWVTRFEVATGNGDVLEPDGAAAAVGSGGPYALAAARALVANTGLDAADIARQAMEIAADICIYTNREVSLLELPGEEA